MADWHKEDLHTKHIYQALNDMRYILKSMNKTQAKHRLKEWFKRFQFHMCSAVLKIAKTLIVREQALLDTIVSPLKERIIKLN